MYYVYVYLDPRKPEFSNGTYAFAHEPFYVGKGKDKRAWKHLLKDRTNNTIKKGKIQRIIDAGYEPLIQFVQTDLEESEAMALERRLIESIGTKWNIRDIPRGPLSNMTSGGDGWTPSEELRKRHSQPGKLNGMYGKTHTPEARQKISEQSKKLKHSVETKQLMQAVRSNGNNYNAMDWMLKLPCGRIEHIRDLAGYCAELGLSYHTIYNTITHKKPVTRGNAKGYQLLEAIKRP